MKVILSRKGFDSANGGRQGFITQVFGRNLGLRILPKPHRGLRKSS